MKCPLCSGTGHIMALPRKPEIPQTIERLLKHGMTYTQIATGLDMHKSTVGYYVQKYKLNRFRKELITNPETIDTLAEKGPI